jgi:hypothetical protein
MHASLNNMASFYSTVMSPSPIPTWNHHAGSDADEDEPRRRLLPRHELAAFEEQLSHTVSDGFIGNLPSTLDSPFRLKDVARACAQVKTTAPGPDDIIAPFLKHAPPIVHHCLLTIFNASWDWGPG